MLIDNSIKSKEVYKTNLLGDQTKKNLLEFLAWWSPKELQDLVLNWNISKYQDFEILRQKIIKIWKFDIGNWTIYNHSIYSKNSPFQKEYEESYKNWLNKDSDNSSIEAQYRRLLIELN